MKRNASLQCGHTFTESGPDGVQESTPRVCSFMHHRETDPGVLWMTDQSMAMSDVVSYTPVAP